MRVKVISVAVVLTMALGGFSGWRWWSGERIDGPKDPLSLSRGKALGPGIDVLTEHLSAGEIVGDLDVGFDEHNGLRATRIADGATYWTYGRRWTPWQTALIGPVRADERHVIAVWCDDRVTSIDAPRGAVVWSRRLPRGPGAARCRTDGDETREDAWSMQVVGDAGEPILIVQRADRIDALDARTGRPRWHAATSRGTPLEAFEWTVVAADKDGVVLLDARNGRRLGSLDGAATEATRFVVGLGNDRVAMRGQDSLVVFQAHDGRPLWRVPRTSLDGIFYPEQLAGAGDLLLVRDATSVTGYRAADGRVAWRKPMPQESSRVPTSAVMADGRIGYTTRGDSTLVQFDVRSGDVIDQRDFSDRISLVSIHNGMLKLLTSAQFELIG
jgi:outer membrane protein assembly factor BamB